MKDMAKMGRAMHADTFSFEFRYLELYLIFSVPLWAGSQGSKGEYPCLLQPLLYSRNI